MSLIAFPRFTSVLRREPNVHNSKAKVSPTSTKTGSNTMGTDTKLR